MLENSIKNVDEPLVASAADQQRKVSLWAIWSCAAVFFLSVLIYISVIDASSGFKTNIWIIQHIVLFKRWLPTDTSKGMFQQLDLHKFNLHKLVFTQTLIVLSIMFIAYGLCAWFIQQRAKSGSHTLLFRFIWLGTLVIGCLYLFVPAMITTDVYSYASYGRLLAIYHSNPYFVPPIAHKDGVLQWLQPEWREVVSIYGPIWTVVSTPLALIGGSSQLGITIVFRCFAFLCHLANLALIIATLRTMKRSPHIVLLGAFLYALNPLVLIETAMSGHNDIFMVTFLLLGLYFCARAEQKGTFLQWRGYLPPLLAFTAAVLVKFSAAPILPVFVLAIFFATIQADSKNGRLVWQRALKSVLVATAAFVVVTLACYAPFWIGHSIQDISHGFTSLPSASDSVNSILSVFKNYSNASALPAALNVLKNRTLWNMLNILAMLLPIAVGCLYLWRRPNTATIAVVTLASFVGFLLSTPWFFSWYLIWIVALVPFCLAVPMQRLSRALLAFTLVFSATAFTSYYSTQVGWMLLKLQPPMLTWNIWLALGLLGIPVVVFLAVWLFWPQHSKGDQKQIPSVDFSEVSDVSEA